MEWLNRLDDALDDATQTNQRISNRLHQDRKRGTSGGAAAVVNAAQTAASLSEALSHFRTTRNDTDLLISTKPSLTAPGCQGRPLPPCVVGTAPLVASTSLSTSCKRKPSSKSSQRKQQGTKQKAFGGLDPMAVGNFDVSFVVDEAFAAPSLEPTNKNNNFNRVSENSPWGKVLLGSMAAPSSDTNTPRKEKQDPTLSEHNRETPLVKNHRLEKNPSMKEAMMPPSSDMNEKQQQEGSLDYREFQSGDLDEISLVNETENHNNNNNSSVQSVPKAAHGGSSGSEERNTLPQHVMLQASSEFEVDRIFSNWDDDLVDSETDNSFHPSMNCYGVFFVRIIRAQRLPCPVHSSVHAVVALPPWKGKVRTPKTKAFAGGGTERDCVRADWSDMEEKAAVSMVHAYSSEDSPVPSIRIGLIFSASSLGVLEFEMCSVEIPCHALLKEPMIPKSGWFKTVVCEKQQKHGGFPLVQIEAIFEPEEKVVRAIARAAGATSFLEGDETEVGEADESFDVDGLSLLPDVNENSSVSGAQLNLSLPGTPTSRKTNHPRSILHHDEPSLSDFSTSLSSFRNVDTPVSSSKPHLLRLHTFYVLARCAVCSNSITSGFRKKPAYHCEECKIDCCTDCRLQVDFSLPCGSKAAKFAAENSIQSKLTAENILRIVAPIPESPLEYEESSPTSRKEETEETLSTTDSSRPVEKVAGLQTLSVSAGRIGVLKVNIIKAVVLQSPLSQDSFPPDAMNSRQVNKGDYYIRISGSDGSSVRTRTVQGTGKPKFASEVSLPVPHYGVDFSLELIDASTDQVVGASVLSAKSILQEQRDIYASATIIPFVWIFAGPVTFNKYRRVLCELRKLKESTAHTFFSSETSGDVVGVVELDIILEEDSTALYSKHPYQCPAKPSDDRLDISVLQSHIARLSYLVRDVNKMIEVYTFLVSWENPTVTVLCACIYFFLCISFDPEYIGAAPLFILLALMVFLGFDRAQGRFQRRFINRELEQLRERDTSDVRVHRPVGMIKVKVLQGRNLRSPELGLSGSAGCRISLDLGRLLSTSEREKAIARNKIFAAPHELGSTENIFSSDPTWNELIESPEAKRLRQLFPPDGGFFEYDRERDMSTICFPFLQPGEHKGKEFSLMRWADSNAALVFEVRFSDLVSFLPGADYALGEVVIPVSTLISHGEVRGWFKVNEPGDGRSQFHPYPKVVEDGSPQVLIHLHWVPPEELSHQEPEASAVILEEMVRAAVLYQQQKVTLFGSSVGAFNTVRGLSGSLLSVQNALGALLDSVESFMNVFNFTDPYKSTVVFGAVFLVWMALSTVPTRWLMIGAGIAQFAASLQLRVASRRSNQSQARPSKELSKQENSTSSVAVWLSNAFHGLPTDEDLRRTYYWDTRRMVARETLSRSNEKRNARLKNLWHAKWHGEVDMMIRREPGRTSQRKPVFGVVQGHRLLFWESVEHFDGGDMPSGQLFLRGHAGVATPSPVEMREVFGEEKMRMVVIFGRGHLSQERVTLLCREIEQKESLEEAVQAAMADKID